MKYNNKVYSHKLLAFAISALIGVIACMIFGGKSWAISGANTYFPDTSPFGQAQSYAIVQVTGWNVTNSSGVNNANTKMKARTTVASIYVPKSLEGSTVTVNIVNGCNGTIRDNDPSFGSTDFFVQNVTTGTNLAYTNTGYPGCATANKTIPVSFVATALNTSSGNYPKSRTYDNGVDYNIYQFLAFGNMVEAGSTHRYLNAFGLGAVTGGVQVGISDFPIQCDIATYSMSCPSPRVYNGVAGSWVYTSFYGPSPASILPNYTQQIQIRNSCAVNGAISLYDLDASDGSLSQANMQIVLRHRNAATGVWSPVGVVMLNGSTLYALPLVAMQQWQNGIAGVMRAHPDIPLSVNIGGNNDEYLDLPGGDPTFVPVSTFPANEDYSFSIEGIDSDNAIQILPTIDHCLAPIVDTPPTVSISQNCSAPYTVTITVNDADYATNGGNPLINYSINGVAQAAVRARSRVFNMPDPTASVVVSANSTGVNPSPPGGDGPAGALRSGSATLNPCGATFNLTSQPQPPVLNDDELPTSATAAALIGFSGGAGSVNGVSTTREYFKNRGGTYDAVAGTITGGTNTSLMANTVLSVNVTSKPTDSVLGTTAIAGISGVQASDYICMRLTLSPATGMVSNASPGTILSSSGSSVRVQCRSVISRPYMRVYGSDVMAGSGFGSNCTAPASNSDIVGFAKQLTTPASEAGKWVGSGGQFGAFTAGTINQFITSSLLSPLAPSTLAFANTSASGSVIGGGFDSKFCDDDFWATKSTSMSASNGAIPALHSLSSGQYQYQPGATINAAPQDLTKRIAIYVDGDVTINTNIRLSTSAVASTDLLPSFYLIVRGNIYIAPGVTQLDGIYVAMPKSPATNLNTPADGGRIFTCTDAGSAPTPGALTGPCVTNKLTVNGVLAAKRVNFLRGGGSLRSATSAEPSTSGNISEVINFIPETLLAVPAPSVTTSGQYDSVIGLPPSL